MLLTLLACLFVWILPVSGQIAHAATVSFVNPSSPSNPFWSAVTRNMRDAAKDLDMELRIIYTNGSRLQMVNAVRNELDSSDKPDYLLLVNEPYALSNMLELAEQAKVKTFTFMNPLHPGQKSLEDAPRSQDFSHWLGMLLPDNRRGMTETLNQQLECIRQKNQSPPYHLLALFGSESNPASRVRRAALQQAAARAPDILLDRALYTDWNQQRSQQLTESYLDWSQRNRVQPALIWTENNLMAASVVKALRDKGLTPGKDVCIASMDVSSAGLNMLEKGLLSSLSTGHTFIGALALVILHDYSRGSDFVTTETPYTTSVSLIQLTPENAARYRQRMRNQKWRFDYREFSRFYNPEIRYSELLKLKLQNSGGVIN